MIVVMAEHTGGTLNRATWETLAAAQRAGRKVTVVVPGTGVATLAAELAAARVDEVVALEHPALESYTADGMVQALASWLSVERPSFVFLPHTYQTRDFVPALAIRLGWSLMTDCVATKGGPEGVVFVRPVFQGRLHADVSVTSGSAIVTFQVGAMRADAVEKGAAPAPIRMVAASVDAAAIRQQPEAPYREARQAVDLSQAERIVAVGRGIKDQDKLALAEQLAAAMGAELGASRPICDAGWVPMDRQIGSSGQTVAPKLYVALGISGAIQHLVGMKGSRVIVAINKDPDAPVFEAANYGIVGDLFDVVPAIIKELQR
jgi:electron transfer flavoprotein alpha subunit